MSSISFQNVTVRFPLYQGGNRSLKKKVLSFTRSQISSDGSRFAIDALSDLTFNIKHGERIGLVGLNGAGKTTLLRVMSGVYEPVKGRVIIDGNISALLNMNLGLNPDATGYENITLSGIYMGLHPEEIRKMTPEIAEFTELGDFLHMPVRTYSAGMMVRLGFSVATAIKPDILLLDEWLMAGDHDFMAKAQRRVASFIEQSKIMIVASHSSVTLSKWCTRILWLDKGRIVMDGPTDIVLPQYESGVFPTQTDQPL